MVVIYANIYAEIYPFLYIYRYIHMYMYADAYTNAYVYAYVQMYHLRSPNELGAGKNRGCPRHYPARGWEDCTQGCLHHSQARCLCMYVRTYVRRCMFERV